MALWGLESLELESLMLESMKLQVGSMRLDSTVLEPVRLEFPVPSESSDWQYYSTGMLWPHVSLSTQVEQQIPCGVLGWMSLLFP
jgi:hypothetical protein